MKLLLLGSTGATGKHLLELALAGGHEVTALVRDATALPARPHLTVVAGQATVAADVEKVVNDQDAVLSVHAGFRDAAAAAGRRLAA